MKALLNYLMQWFLAPYSALILIDLDPLLLFRTHCNATCGQIFIPIDALPIYVFHPPAKPSRLSIYVDLQMAATYGNGCFSSNKGAIARFAADRRYPRVCDHFGGFVVNALFNAARADPWRHKAICGSTGRSAAVQDDPRRRGEIQGSTRRFVRAPSSEFHWPFLPSFFILI